MMDERRNGHQGETFVPPTPENIKPKGSRDNAVEMAAGGAHERAALDAQREKMASASRATDDPGRTDNPLGTGVGYAGEGSAAYGEQEKRMSTNNPKRPDETDKSATTQRQAEQQHQQQYSSGQKPGAGGTGGTSSTGGTGSQQSTGSMPPSQGTGSTPESHTPRPSSAETHAHHGTTNAPSQTSGTHDTEASKGAIGGTQEHGTVKTPQGQNVSTQGHGIASEEQRTSESAQSQAHTTASDAKSAVQDKASDLKDQGQEKMAEAQRQAQDTLESIRANLQTKTDALKGTVTDKTGQLRDTMTGKTDQLVGTVGEKGDLAKQAANEKSTQAGERLTGLADSLREKTQTLEPDHPVATAATKAAGALEQTGTYLQQSTPDDWMGDLKQLISRKPVESVLIAAGLGYMAARAFRK